ncbi:MAG: hypothetical protein WC866_06045 [Patescibacteria group bacterium]|jgi:hypothetical protein
MHLQEPYDLLDPLFLATRETFPGEKTFHELARGFFSHEAAELRGRKIAELHASTGVLVHMANPEQLDDLFAHIHRQHKVRYLSTTYLHKDIRTSVYAIGRGTGILIDPAQVKIEHVSLNDSNSETDHDGRLVASDDKKVSTIEELHAALLAEKRDDWNEINASFEGASPILGFFALDGVMSKLYASALWIKAGGLLPVYTYNRGANLLAEFTPTPEAIRAFADQTTSPHLREKYRSLAPLLERVEARVS